jgi:NAD(P)-dependent dehydrogenase (short-subunit alcohol dehydrogenase family)
MDIKGAAAIVTGGASGLGEATVRRLAAAGAVVTILDFNADKGEALAKELGAKFVKADVTDAEQVAEAVAASAEDAPLRVGVNCAGTGTAVRTIGKDGTPHIRSEWDRVLGINLLGTFFSMTCEASQIYKSEPLADGQRGVIINTASVAAFDGQIGQLAYAASKGGVVAMTLPAARDLSVAGIRVVTIAPGLMDTPLLGLLPAEAKAALGASVVYPKRLGDPEEYAKMAMAIVDNDYLNGETIRLDGAIRMQPK